MEFLKVIAISIGSAILILSFAFAMSTNNWLFIVSFVAWVQTAIITAAAIKYLKS